MRQETRKGTSEARAQSHVECWLCHLMNESFIESVRRRLVIRSLPVRNLDTVETDYALADIGGDAARR